MKNIKKKLLVFFHTRNLIPVKNLVHKAKDKRIITTQMNFINFFKKVTLKFERQSDEFILQLMQKSFIKKLA